MSVFELKAVVFLGIAVVNFIFALFLWKKGKTKATLHLGFFALFSSIFALSHGGAYYFWGRDDFLSLVFTRTTWSGILMLPAFLTFT